MPVDNRRIDRKVLEPIAVRYHLVELKTDPERWTDYEVQQIISECGPEWAAVSVENVRLQCCNLRKAGVLGRIGDGKNRGKTKYEKPPAWYQHYLETKWWKAIMLKSPI